MEFNDENSVVLITHLYIRSKYPPSSNPDTWTIYESESVRFQFYRIKVPLYNIFQICTTFLYFFKHLSFFVLCWIESKTLFLSDTVVFLIFLMFKISWDMKIVAVRALKHLNKAIWLSCVTDLDTEKSYEIKPKSDCSNHFPIYLEWNRLPFGSKSS